ncbi:MAG: hypothetical protein J2P54_00235 [Bradyrhizobiaceae bacterium]|nr:hypothetical protein [Bradyrhizobiaceae bacterium]
MPPIDDLETKYFPGSLPPGVPNWHETLVIPHVDGNAYFAAIADALDDVSGVGDRIYITSWCFNPELTLRRTPGSPRLEDILLAKSRAGVDVRLIVAAPRFSFSAEGRNPFEVDFWVWAAAAVFGRDLEDIIIQNVRSIRYLRQEGGPHMAQRLLLDWGGRADSRHEKVTIVFNSAQNELRAFVGGIDYREDRRSDELHEQGWWHDGGFELLAGAAAAVTSNFLTRWIETATLPPQIYTLDGKIEQFNPTTALEPPWTATGMPKPLPATAPAGQYLGASVRVIRSYDMIRAMEVSYTDPYIQWKTLPPMGVRETLQLLEKAIPAATSYIYIEDQTLNPSVVESLYAPHTHIFPLLSAACGNGIKVILVTSGYNGPDQPMPQTTLSAEITQRILDPLAPAQRDNLAAFYIRDTKVHTKLVMIDDEFALIGSANMWDRSMTGVESEVGVALVHEGGENSLIGDLRVRLWRSHLRVEQSAAVDAELRKTSLSFGIFNSDWGDGVSFPYPLNAFSPILL